MGLKDLLVLVPGTLTPLLIFVSVSISLVGVTIAVQQYSTTTGIKDFLVVPRGSLTPLFLTLSSLPLLIVTIVVQQFLAWRKLRLVPGPFWNSIQATIWMVKSTIRGRQQLDFFELQQKYGPLCRIGSNKVMTDDPEVLRRIESVRSEYSKAPSYYSAFRIIPGRDNVFSMTDTAEHIDRRFKVAPGYAGKDNECLEETVDMIVGQLVDLLDRKYSVAPWAGGSQLMNFAETAQFFALDVISQFAWGKAFGFTVADEDLHNYLHQFDKLFVFSMVMSALPPVAWLLQQWPFHLMGPKPTDKSGYGKLMGLANESIDKRLAPGARPRKDMLGSWIARGLTRDELQVETYLQIIAGANSTATTMRTTMAYLLVTPPAYAALQAEIDAAEAAGKLSSPIVKDAEAKALRYLQAVIKESLRMLPPANGLLYKRVPEGGDVIHGYYLPEGTVVGSSIYSLAHNKAFWGDDADVFRPERWIEAEETDPARYRLMLDRSDLIFGHGKFQCLGKPIAYMELNKAFVELFRRFDFSATNITAIMKLRNAGFYLINEQLLKVTKRHKAAA